MMSTSRFPIFKVSATGNDFLLIDLLDPEMQKRWQTEFAQIPRAELVRTWCDRHEGLGADGLVVLETDPTLDFAWDFYNSDGGMAEMCGNAARAVSLFFHKKSGKTQLKFRSKVGEVAAVVRSADEIEVTLPAIKESQLNQQEQDLSFDFVRAGVPHAVVRVPRSESRSGMQNIALQIKKLSRFAEEGVNVTFLHEVSANQVESVTFERGVEGFTRACGTGAIAAAYSVIRGEEGQEVQVQVPGGQLTVLWIDGKPHLRGPAKIVAEMRVIRSEEL